MDTLNLVYPESGNINYEKVKFPDGQQDVKIKLNNQMTPKSVMIVSRFNNFRDLEIILCATKALRNMGIKELYLTIPYLLGGRSDRLFQYGGTSYLRDIVAPIINAQNYEKVITLDTHSDVTEACINNLVNRNNHQIIYHFINNLFNDDKKFTLISPDAGALKKVWSLLGYLKFEKINVDDDIIIASKHRDINTGNITHTEVPLKAGEHTHNRFLIVDDICDGGRTFIEIAKVIKDYRPEAKIYLVVTHGIFSKGLYELSKYFDAIFTTNSISDINTSEFSDYTVDDNFLNQYNVYG